MYTKCKIHKYGISSNSSRSSIRKNELGYHRTLRNKNICQKIIEKNNDNILCYTGKTKGLYGVGFIVQERWKKNIEIKFINDRMIAVILSLGTTKIAIIQLYVSTENPTDATINQFYDKLEEI